MEQKKPWHKSLKIAHFPFLLVRALICLEHTYSAINLKNKNKLAWKGQITNTKEADCLNFNLLYSNSVWKITSVKKYFLQAPESLPPSSTLLAFCLPSLWLLLKCACSWAWGDTSLVGPYSVRGKHCWQVCSESAPTIKPFVVLALTAGSETLCVLARRMDSRRPVLLRKTLLLCQHLPAESRICIPRVRLREWSPALARVGGLPWLQQSQDFTASFWLSSPVFSPVRRLEKFIPDAQRKLETRCSAVFFCPPFIILWKLPWSSPYLSASCSIKRFDLATSRANCTEWEQFWCSLLFSENKLVWK